MKTNKKNHIWIYKINVPDDGSVPTATFRPWSDLSFMEKFNKIAQVIFVIVSIYYTMYKLANFCGRVLMKPLDYCCKFKAKLKSIISKAKTVRLQDLEEDEDFYMDPEKEYFNHNSEQE